jgi:hypothetical protein
MGFQKPRATSMELGICMLNEEERGTQVCKDGLSIALGFSSVPCLVWDFENRVFLSLNHNHIILLYS